MPPDMYGCSTRSNTVQISPLVGVGLAPTLGQATAPIGPLWGRVAATRLVLGHLSQSVLVLVHRGVNGPIVRSNDFSRFWLVKRLKSLLQTVGLLRPGCTRRINDPP